MKKPNPRRIPRTQADVDHALKLGQAQGVDLAMTIFFTAMMDKGIVPREQVPKMWDACLYVSDSIIKGYVNIYEQQRVLQEEYGISFEKIRV